MGIFGGGDSSGDRTMMGVAIFCTIMSLVVTFGVALMLPANVGYDWDEVQQARQEVVGFTGDTMLNTTPWKLTGVYTPWVMGSTTYNESDGFLYGEDVTNDYEYAGKTTGIKLDANQKSTIPLAYGTTMGKVENTHNEWWANIAPLALIGVLFGADPTYVTYDDHEFSVWNYTGYRYEFDPMLPFKYGEDAEQSAVDGKLSIVWYKNKEMDGVSGGLVIYGSDNVLLANIEAADIVANYNTLSAYSSRYRFDFMGADIYLNVRFDPTVVNDSMDLQSAWNNGDWSIAITSPSAGTFLDVKNSTSFTSTLGNIVSTFQDIFTFDLPNLEGYWSLILWVLVSFPAELAFLFFCSKLGIAGIPAAILGNALVIAG